MTRGLLLLALALFAPFACAAQNFPNLSPKPRPNGPYQIRGKVVNGQTGQPIAGAEIRIYESAQNVREMFEVAESAADGSFYFDGIAEGKYTLMAARRGYAPQAYLQHENYWSGVAVGPGKDALHLRFPLYPSAQISGRVTDENGEGVRDVVIKLWKESLQNGEKKNLFDRPAVTDDQGRYRFGHLAGGKYAISVAAVPWFKRFMKAARPSLSIDPDGPATAADSANANLTRADAPKEESEPDNSLLDLVYPSIFYPTGHTIREASWFQLRPGEEQTADLQLSCIPGVHVLISTAQTQETGPWMVRIFQAADEGELETPGTTHRQIAPGLAEIGGLAPGSYRLQLTVPGMGGVHEEEVEIKGDAQLDFRGEVPSGQVISGIMRFLKPPEDNAWVVLQIRDEAGRKSLVRSVPTTRENADKMESKEFEYSFQIGNLAAGTGVYELSAVSPQGVTIEKIEATGARVNGNRVTVDGTGEAHLKLVVSESSTALRGTATKKGRPFAAAMILLLPESGQPELVRRDQSDSDGTFALPNVVPGKYWLMALENGWELPWADPEQQKTLFGKGVAVVIGKDAPAPFKIEVE
jgi:5-hydroxyisourate hydrolase-like protein (transthyretin family)